MLSELYLDRRDSLLRVLTRIVRSRQTAEDLVQEAYLRVARAMESGQIEKPEAFLNRTARNLALDHQRQSSARARVEPETLLHAASGHLRPVAPGTEDTLIARERDARFASVLGSLPPRARSAWTLCMVDGLTYAEAAERLGISRNTVYNDIKLATGTLHDALRRYEGS